MGYPFKKDVVQHLLLQQDFLNFRFVIDSDCSLSPKLKLEFKRSFFNEVDA